MIPVFAVARLPAATRHDEDRYARRLDCGVERPQVVEQANLGADLLHPRPDLPALRPGVGVGVDERVGDT